MKTRRADVEIIYNGAAVTTKMLGQAGEVTYTDPACGEADSLDISINDRNRKWINEWMPAEGDTITATIRAYNWEREGDNRNLRCGLFILDDFTFSGWPVAGNISGVSTPADDAFMSTERSKNWENVTIQEIGKEIAKRAGISLAWDVAGEPFIIKNVEQSQQTDCEFYMSLCNTYGLAMKVYSKKIVVYDREAYKAKPAAARISATEIATWSWSRSTTGTYTGGEYTYTDPSTEEEIKVNVGTGARILKQSGKADDVADAERKIKAAVANANHGHTKLSMTVNGRPDIVASICVEVTGLGRLSGKYFVDKATSHVSGGGGYTTDLELSLV